MPIGSKRHAEGPGNTELRYKVGMWAAIRAWKLGGKLESCDNFCQIQSPKGDLTHFSKYSKILTTLSFRRKPESSQNNPEDDYFSSMVIDALLDAGSSPA